MKENKGIQTRKDGRKKKKKEKGIKTYRKKDTMFGKEYYV